MDNVVNKTLNEHEAKDIIADKNGTVEIPAGTEIIGERAFDGCPNIKILASQGSYAQQYAKMLNLNKIDDTKTEGEQNEDSQKMGSPSSYAFISYSTKNQDVADAMREVLKKRGFNIWMAPEDIPAGSKYAEVINKAIKNCSCLILILSEASQNSIWVAKEVERAVHYQKPIVPVQIENVVLNDEFEFYISTDQIVTLKKIDESSAPMCKILRSVGAILRNNQREKEGLSTISSNDVTTVNRIMIEKPGFELRLSYNYSGNIYFRHFEKGDATEYAFTVNESFKDTLADLLNKIYCAIRGMDVITTRFKWLDETTEYICKEIPEREYGNRDDSCKGKFKVLCLEHCENSKFDSFEIGLRTNDFYVLLYKHGGPGGYAYYGIDPNTPLSYFGIDENKLIDAAKELIQFAYPNKDVIIANKFHREDSSVNNSGAVYNRLSFIVD